MPLVRRQELHQLPRGRSGRAGRNDKHFGDRAGSGSRIRCCTCKRFRGSAAARTRSVRHNRGMGRTESFLGSGPPPPSIRSRRGTPPIARVIATQMSTMRRGVTSRCISALTVAMRVHCRPLRNEATPPSPSREHAPPSGAAGRAPRADRRIGRRRSRSRSSALVRPLRRPSDDDRARRDPAGRRGLARAEIVARASRRVDRGAATDRVGPRADHGARCRDLVPARAARDRGARGAARRGLHAARPA